MSNCKCPNCGSAINVVVMVTDKAPVILEDPPAPEVEMRPEPPPVHVGPPRLLRIHEASEIAGCSPSTFYRRSNEGIYPEVDRGRVWSDALYSSLNRTDQALDGAASRSPRK